MFLSSQLLELFVVGYTTYFCCYRFWRVRLAFVHADAKSGPVRRDSLPNGLWNVPFTALQIILFSVIPMIYIFTVISAGLQQPAWMNMFALPEVIFDVRVAVAWRNAFRILACVANNSLEGITNNVFEHLGDQYHPVGVRFLFTLSTFSV